MEYISLFGVIFKSGREEVAGLAFLKEQRDK